MPNFTEKLIADVAAQAAEIAELKTALAAIADKVNPPPQPKPKVDSRPTFVKESQDQYVARKRAEAQAHREKEAGYLGAMTANLPEGQYKDPCGIVRWLLDGKPVNRTDRADAAMTEFKAQDDHIRWLRDQDLPVPNVADGADDADDDGA